MRSHFAESAVAVATFVAAYLLFDNQQHLASLSGNQVENLQATLEGKSDRLAVKEDEELHVEVKGSTQTADNVELTRNEVLHAHEIRTDLYVVDCIDWDG